MVAVGFATMYLSVAGLPALSPIPARITLCERMEPNFLVRKVLQDRWNWSINIQDGQEQWEASGDTVATLTMAEAAFFNAGFAEQEKASHPPPAGGTSRGQSPPTWGNGLPRP